MVGGWGIWGWEDRKTGGQEDRRAEDSCGLCSSCHPCLPVILSSWGRLLPVPVQVKAVLWVDDEAELLEPHRIFLRDKGFEVETATNADDALEMVRRRPFDLVLLDEQMPGTRGLEAVKEIREIEPGLQIVMVTKSEEDGTLTEALGKNIAGYLVKPVTPRQVYAMVCAPARGSAASGNRLVARTFVEAAFA